MATSWLEQDWSDPVQPRICAICFANVSKSFEKDHEKYHQSEKSDPNIPVQEMNQELLGVVLEAVDAEIQSAIRKHGFLKTPLNVLMDDRDKMVILMEEVGEVANAMTYDEGDQDRLYEELIQVAAMAIGFAYSVVARME